MVLAAAAAPAANASADSAAAPRVELRGTVSPLVAQGLAHVVGTPSAAKQVQAVVAFKPRNAILLHWLAERSTGRPGMSNAEIHRLFAPRPATVAAVRSYLNANGLSVVDSTDMSLVVSGTAAAAEQAFGVGLRLYRDARGTHVSGAVGERPAAQGDRVGRAVGGGARFVARSCTRTTRSRSTCGRGAAGKVRLRAALRHRLQQRRNKQTTPGGFLPQDLAADRAYDHDGLISGGSDGIRPVDRVRRVLELQPRRREPLQELLHAASRPGSTTGRRRPSAAARPTTSARSRSTSTSRLRWARRRTPARRSTRPPTTWRSSRRCCTRCATDGVDVVSDSWGLCELFVPVKLTANENTALELLAVQRRVVLCRLGRRRGCRLPRGEPGREVPGDRRPVRPAARDGRRRDEPPDRSGRGREGLEGLRRRDLDQLAQAGLPARRPHARRAGRLLLERHGPVPRDARHRHGRRTADRLHHLLPRARRGSDARLGHRRRHERRRAAHGRDHRGCERVAPAYESRLREPVHLPGSRAGDFHDITQGNNVNCTGSSFQAGPGFDLVTGRGSVDREHVRDGARRLHAAPSSRSTRRSSRRRTRPT